MIGEKIEIKEHIEAISNGLDEEYEIFHMTFDMRKNSELTNMEGVEALLLSHVSRIKKKNKSLDATQSSHSILVNFVGTSQYDKRGISRGFNARNCRGFEISRVLVRSDSRFIES